MVFFHADKHFDIFLITKKNKIRNINALDFVPINDNKYIIVQFLKQSKNILSYEKPKYVMSLYVIHTHSGIVIRLKSIHYKWRAFQSLPHKKGTHYKPHHKKFDFSYMGLLWCNG